MYIHVSTLILARSIRGLDLTDPLYFYNILWSKTKKLFFFNCLLILSGRFDPRSTFKNDGHIACTLSICAFSWHFNNTVQSAGIFLRIRFCFRYHAYLLDYVCCCCCCFLDAWDFVYVSSDECVSHLVHILMRSDCPKCAISQRLEPRVARPQVDSGPLKFKLLIYV